MIDRVRADRHQRIGGKPRDLLPAHAQILAERRDVDLIAGGEIADDGAHFGFRRRGRSHQ